MTSPLEQIPAEIRARYATVGLQFGSGDTLAQAEDTLTAYDKFGVFLADHGFIASDVERLMEARRVLRQAGVGLDKTVTARKQTSLKYVQAMRQGKTARQRARSILHIVMQRLACSGDSVQVEASRAVSSTLEQTQSSRGDPVCLAAQLDQLRAVLTMARVDREVADRGGPSAVSVLAESAACLRAAAKNRVPGDAEDPIDFIDGVIVELVRDARRAARSASRTLGRPEIAAAFELVRLSGGEE